MASLIQVVAFSLLAMHGCHAFHASSRRHIFAQKIFFGLHGVKNGIRSLVMYRST
jgi:hypothetical protein